MSLTVQVDTNLINQQLLNQARAVAFPNSISEAAANALSKVGPRVCERARAALALHPELLQLGRAGLLAAAVMCICW
jgi:hypothetical protein